MSENIEDLESHEGVDPIYDIHWEAWVDAYDNDSIESLQDIIREEDEQLAEFGIEPEQKYSPPIKTIMTPFGILPLTEDSLASKSFKFWVGHSNFKLLDSFYELIESCEGVESVDIMTPYRFRIAVGKMFQDRDVMYNVKLKLTCWMVENERTEQ
mgnify:CR=1 FL=1